jgi:KUP system potassium uptake protein
VSHGRTPPSGKVLAGLALTALGVVYGDIGTSPLYALKECFNGPNGVVLTRDNVLGVLSLVFWSLNFVISFKYIAIVLQADNRGEGGILALLALARPRGSNVGRGLVMFGLFGAALLYGDGVITPAISVLSAVEGLHVATPALDRWVIPLTIGILSGLFLMQRRGTAGVGAVFGPITFVWFLSIAAIGINGIVGYPGVVRALNPYYAFAFAFTHGWRTLLVLGSVFLVVTGGEALYADMGHFGKRPIRLAWFALVLPALMLNYLGQGALLLRHPEAVGNPFFNLVPNAVLYEMVAIATAAAIVASQALISGAFSLTQQAIQLGFMPRMRLVHTSSTEFGQIYMPGVNGALWIACVALVLAFKSSDRLAATYGVAVTGTMLITSVLFAVVARNRWNWSWWRVIPITGAFLVVDTAFAGANLVKFVQGGWFPLAAGSLLYLLMSTWRRGRQQVTAILTETALPLDLFVPDMARRKPHRVPGVAVFMTSIPDVAPAVLLHHLKHNKVLHEKVILMTVTAQEIPQVPEADRVQLAARGEGFYQVTAHYGFMETPNVPAILAAVTERMRDPGAARAPSTGLHEVSFFLGRETLIVASRHHGAPRAQGAMWGWRARLFGVMQRNAQSATAFFGLPPNRVIELGAQIQV